MKRVTVALCVALIAALAAGAGAATKAKSSGKKKMAGGATSVLVTNIVGFFIDSVSGTDVTGYLVRHPGLRAANAITLFDDSSFLRATMLVQ